MLEECVAVAKGTFLRAFPTAGPNTFWYGSPFPTQVTLWALLWKYAATSMPVVAMETIASNLPLVDTHY